MVRYLLMASCLLAAGCFEQKGDRPGDPQGNGQKDDLAVYEAVFRYRLEKHSVAVKPADLQAYLSVNGKDPPAELMKQLRKDWPNLKPVSEEPKEKGLRIYVEDLKWESGTTAVLQAGYWFPTKFAGEGYFGDHHVTFEKGKWVVEKVTGETSS